MIAPIDMLTIVFTLFVMNMVSAFFLVAYIRMTKDSSNLRYFVASKGVQCSAWFLLYLYYSYGFSSALLPASILLMAGFGLESALFLSFKKQFTWHLKLFYSLSIIVGSLMIIGLGASHEYVRNLLVLIYYLGYMTIIAWTLIFYKSTTPFQRFLGYLYGIVPLISSCLFIFVGEEVRMLGYTTTPIGFVYYIFIVMMQMIGSVGYLLIVKEFDEHQLIERAATDPLTGILNRKAFFERAENRMNRAFIDQKSLSIIMLDLDHFKSINDQYGHQIGDHVILHLCEAITKNLRKTDMFARYGGEEFVILLPDTNSKDAQTLALQLYSGIYRQQHAVKGLPYYTLSMGLSSGIPSHKDDLDNLLGDSDKALYHAKHHGRNCLAVLPLGGSESDITTLSPLQNQQAQEEQPHVTE